MNDLEQTNKILEVQNYPNREDMKIQVEQDMKIQSKK